MTILLFGATGSAGGSVLQACLADADVTEVRAVVRRPIGRTHDKLRELIHEDYLRYQPIAGVFAGVDACVFCLGKSVRQVSGEEEYRRITYEYAIAAGIALHEASPSAAFHYLSGAGASLTSRFMWARVKAEAERDLMSRVDAVCWRPGSIDGMPSASEPRAYKLFRPMARLALRPFASLYVTGEDIGRAMLMATKQHLRNRIIENAEIREMARG